MHNDLVSKTILHYMPDADITEIFQIIDGLAKHTYKVNIDNKAYVFQAWIEPSSGLTSSDDHGLFFGSVGNLIAATELLENIGVHVPGIVFTGVTQGAPAVPCLLMEFIDGFTPFQKPDLFSDHNFITKTANDIGKINSQTRDRPGTVSAEHTDMNYANACLLAFESDLRIAIQFDPFVKEHFQRIHNKAREAHDRIKPRNFFNLTLGDIKPNHLIWTRSNELYFLDLEGAKYGDIEFEIAGLAMPYSFTSRSIFLETYFKRVDIKIDDARNDLYKLYRYITAIAFVSECLSKSQFTGQSKEISAQVHDACIKGLYEDFLK